MQKIDSKSGNDGYVQRRDDADRYRTGCQEFCVLQGVKQGWGADYMRTFLAMRNMADE